MNKYRTHNCSELSEKDIDKKVYISGWLHRKRDHGNLLFIDLRDHYGMTQCVIENKNDFFPLLEKTKPESVLKIKRSSSPMVSNIGTIPIPFAKRIKKKNVRKRGVHVITQFWPTLGLDIESFTNSTRYSIIVTHLDFSFPLLEKYFLNGMIMTNDKMAATIHNIKTCLVTEKSIPKSSGILIIGCSLLEFET